MRARPSAPWSGLLRRPVSGTHISSRVIRTSREQNFRMSLPRLWFSEFARAMVGRLASALATPQRSEWCWHQTASSLNAGHFWQPTHCTGDLSLSAFAQSFGCDHPIGSFLTIKASIMVCIDV
jgi:hypothetical protein